MRQTYAGFWEISRWNLSQIYCNAGRRVMCAPG